jgi:type II secretory pathway component PulK
MRMKTFIPSQKPHPPASGSVLIIVMWIVFGLISIAIYFANSMTFELRAADNRVAGIEAEQAIEGARRYLSCVLSNLNEAGAIPDPQTYQCEAVPVGNAKFWLIGRTNEQTVISSDTPAFGLVDEASKLNLNVALSNALVFLPRMTPDLAASIVTWRTTNTSNAGIGAESDTYLRQQPPYLCKNAPFETVGELRLIYTMDMNVLYGEDANLNGILDPNENDADVLPPEDNKDGRLDPGVIEYVTVYTREPANGTNGSPRYNITTAAGVTGLRTNLQQLFGTTRANQILPNRGTNSATYTSPLQFYVTSKMTPTEFAQIEGSIRGTRIQGLVNVNTASVTVLACLPGMDINSATQLANYRQSSQADPNSRNSITWVTSAITDSGIIAQIGPWITGKSYQFTADVAAVGHNGRGYRRTRFVFDLSSGAPKILYRQDLSHLGWALGKQVRSQLLAKNSP